MGIISDHTGGDIQVAYIMPVVCMAFILWFGFRGHRIRAVKPAVA
jgi:fucose permease